MGRTSILPENCRFSCAYDNFGKASRGASYKFGRLIGKHNGLDHTILVFVTLTRLLVIREGLLNKLRDYRDCRYERADRRSCRPKADVRAHISL